jgi:hypothetical protein
MNCFFCAESGTHEPAVGVCTDCGRAACERHGAVETVSISVRTGNMFEQRPAQASRFHCDACRTLVAAR